MAMLAKLPPWTPNIADGHVRRVLELLARQSHKANAATSKPQIEESVENLRPKRPIGINLRTRWLLQFTETPPPP